jgi:predicted metal-dependent hydrolase
LKRYLFISKNSFGYRPCDREYLLGLLRCCAKTPNIRIASRHVEIEVWDPDLPTVVALIRGVVGEIILWRSLGEDMVQHYIANMPEILRRFVDLFNEERFWEAHEALEPLWRSTGERVLQGLILVAASFVKIQESKVEEFKVLAKKALTMLNNMSRYMCIDISRVRETLKVSIETFSPFKITCNE